MLRLLAVAAAALVLLYFLSERGDPEWQEIEPPSDLEAATGAASELVTPDAVNRSSSAPEPEVSAPVVEPTESSEASGEAPEPAPDPPPGCLRIEATRDGEPLAGETVMVERTRNNWIEEEVELDDRTRALPLGADGTVLACDLEPGDYVLMLEAGASTSFQRRVRLAADRGAVERFLLSTAAVHGTVVDWDGASPERALVTVYGPGRRADAVMALAFTQPDGTYRVQGLAPGGYSANAYFEGSTYSTMDDSAGFELECGEERRLDLGLRPGSVLWSGRVRNRKGDLVASSGPGFREVTTVTLYVSKKGEPGLRKLRVDDSGSFEGPFLPGEYSVSASLSSHPGRIPSFAEVEVPGRDFERDLTLPGTRLAGEVLGAVRLPMNVRAHLDGHIYPAAFYSTPVNEAGEFAFEALPPGEWRVGPGPAPLAEFSDIVLEEGALEVLLDVAAPR